MAKHILRCKDGTFTMNETCPDGSKALPVKPPKYSPDEKYVELKRSIKRKDLEDKDLL